MTTVSDVIDIRKRKKDLYISLLNKGLRNLTEVERKILENLSQDDDIQLMLKNGCAFKD